MNRPRIMQQIQSIDAESRDQPQNWYELSIALDKLPAGFNRVG